MKHPSEVVPKRKAAQFDVDGRPLNAYFYTGLPEYYSLMHSIACKIDDLKKYEDAELSKGKIPEKSDKLEMHGSVWVDKTYLEKELEEKLTEAQYEQWIRIMERLIQQPYSSREQNFFKQFRKSLVTQSLHEDVEPLLYNEAGKPYMEATGTRKTATAKVRVTGLGVGQVVINGLDILDAIPRQMDREQVMMPLQLTGLLGRVDVEGTVENGGGSSTAGAVRLAVSRALVSFVTPEIIEKLRLAGLLTADPRRRERKKPGQEGSRRKFTWRKR